LQGRLFKDVVRTDNHDNFGLAVMIFLMLFMGRHPFAGRFLSAGEMPISRAIKECRFAYGARRATVQMEKPPGTPTLSIVGDEAAFLFERAFAQEMIPSGRPTPRSAEVAKGHGKLSGVGIPIRLASAKQNASF
jgi:DNA-binding helix-hairpin-helix protein with protein kinase domain